MATQQFDPSPVADVSGWSACSRSYTVAAVRAGVIALVLLGILAAIVLF